MVDDLFVGGNSEEEILRNYERALQRLAYQQRKLWFVCAQLQSWDGIGIRHLMTKQT